jgi:hypothetical protein
MHSSVGLLTLPLRSARDATFPTRPRPRRIESSPASARALPGRTPKAPTGRPRRGGAKTLHVERGGWVGQVARVDSPGTAVGWRCGGGATRGSRPSSMFEACPKAQNRAHVWRVVCGRVLALFRPSHAVAQLLPHTSAAMEQAMRGREGTPPPVTGRGGQSPDPKPVWDGKPGLKNGTTSARLGECEGGSELAMPSPTVAPRGRPRSGVEGA